MKKENKNILLLGGSGLIGNSLAQGLKDEGYNVIIFDLKKPKKISKNIIFIKTDLRNEKIFDKNLKKIFFKFKSIDSVVNCFYIKDKDWGLSFEKLKFNNLKKNLIYQLGIPILTSQKIIKFFLKQKYGNLILFSSIFGLQSPKFETYKNTKINCPIEYATSKAGIISMTKYLAKLFGSKKIRVNCISPGGISDNQSKLFKNKYKKNCLTKGLLDPQDLVGTVKFLISKSSKYINGQNIIIDDGWSL